jgi:hypothetical protein
LRRRRTDARSRQHTQRQSRKQNLAHVLYVSSFRPPRQVPSRDRFPSVTLVSCFSPEPCSV